MICFNAVTLKEPDTFLCTICTCFWFSGSGFQLMVVLGIEFAYVVGAFVDWRGLAGACAIPLALYFGMVFIAKESPSYLLSKGKYDEAKASLQYFRGKAGLQLCFHYCCPFVIQ